MKKKKIKSIEEQDKQTENMIFIFAVIFVFIAIIVVISLIKIHFRLAYLFNGQFLKDIKYVFQSLE